MTRARIPPRPAGALHLDGPPSPAGAALKRLEAFAANAADPIAAAGTGSPAVDAREAWRRFHGAAGHWLLQGMGWWVVEEPELGAVGMVGVFRRERGPDVEIGWSIHRAHWRKGYASEASAAALHFAVAARGAEQVIAHVDKGNLASARVATKIGMRLHGDAAFYSDVVDLYVFEAPAGRSDSDSSARLLRAAQRKP